MYLFVGQIRQQLYTRSIVVQTEQVHKNSILMLYYIRMIC